MITINELLTYVEQLPFPSISIAWKGEGEASQKEILIEFFRKNDAEQLYETFSSVKEVTKILAGIHLPEDNADLPRFNA